MSEEIKTLEQTVAAEPAAQIAEEPQVAEEQQAAAEPQAEEPQAAAEEPQSQEPKKESSLVGKTIAELSDIFKNLMESEDRMVRNHEAENIKSAFYRTLGEVRSKAGAVVDETLDSVEQNFKALYADYKAQRAEYNKELDTQKAQNLEIKKQIIEELKALVDNQEDVSASFPQFRSLQDRWKATGPVPASDFRDINSIYQYNVERFYDMVKINRELRDLDFQKNLEAKQKFCEAAEKLSENENVVSAFAELQKLHEQWKEFGPVAKEYRDSIWARFQAATSVINKKYQAHFEQIKGQQKDNLAAKTALCEKVEEIAAREISSSAEWNTASKEIMDLQAEWRKIGFATKKDNQKIYERFRAGCDAFFGKKKEFYSQFKGEMDENLSRKEALIAKVEQLKDSTEWKKTTEEIIELQKQWKEIGTVSRKKSEALWKRFRAACDAFFAERDKNAPAEGGNFRANLKAKHSVIEAVNAYQSVGAQEDEAAAKKFAADFAAIGFVPFKEKDAVNAAFSEAMAAKFPTFQVHRSSGAGRSQGRGASERPLSEKEKLIRKFNALQSEVETYENNIGFFSASKNSEGIIAQMQEKIEAGKAELASLKEQIRQAEQAEQQ